MKLICEDPGTLFSPGEESRPTWPRPIFFSWEESRPTFKPGSGRYPSFLFPGNPYRPSARGKGDILAATQIEPRLPGRVNPLELERRRLREPWRGPQPPPPPRPTRTARDRPPTRAPPPRGATAAAATTTATGAAAAAARRARRPRPRPRWRRARTGGLVTSAADASGSTRAGGPRPTTTATGDLIPSFLSGFLNLGLGYSGCLVIDLEGAVRDPNVGTRESSLCD